MREYCPQPPPPNQRRPPPPLHYRRSVLELPDKESSRAQPCHRSRWVGDSRVIVQHPHNNSVPNVFRRMDLATMSVAAAWNVAAERSCPCKQPACPAISGGSEVTFKPTSQNCVHFTKYDRRPEDHSFGLGVRKIPFLERTTPSSNFWWSGQGGSLQTIAPGSLISTPGPGTLLRHVTTCLASTSRINSRPRLLPFFTFQKSQKPQPWSMRLRPRVADHPLRAEISHLKRSLNCYKDYFKSYLLDGQGLTLLQIWGFSVTPQWPVRLPASL
ncbi:hypothetical protein J6590_006323 [Homalodisca vitripennis]|nr:hypothetical protein J6590_006323 [Homalodisca vitripennis]